MAPVLDDAIDRFGDQAGTNRAVQRFSSRKILADFWNNIKYQVVTNRKDSLFLRLLPDRCRGAGQNGPLSKIGWLALPVLVLLPWIALGSFLLHRVDIQARAALEAAALERASTIAALLEQQIRAGIESIDLSKSAAGFSGEAHARVGSLSASDSSKGTPVSAATPTATQVPNVTLRISDAALSVRELSFPISQGENALLLQVRLPADALSAAVKHFLSPRGWLVSIQAADGSVLAELDDEGEMIALSDQNSTTALVDSAQQGSYVSALSVASPLGFRVQASTALVLLEEQSRRNWTAFLVVTCLLTATILATDGVMLQKRQNKTGKRATEIQPLSARAAKPPDGDYSLARPSGPLPAGRTSYVRQLDENRLQEALVAGGVCIWEWHRPSHVLVWGNSPACLLRQPSHSAPPSVRMLIRRTFPHERRRVLHAIRVALADGRPLAIDVRVTCFDGTQRWIALRANPIRSEPGHVSGFVGTATDVTDQKRGLSRTDALLREVSHRSKNMLALILAMARLTARDAIDVKTHLKEFTLRVAGLSASQDLIVAADWQSVDLMRLASAEIEAVARSDSSRIKISGPPVLVTPEAAQTLGMIFTELALNASMNGALSVASGEVVLSWAFPDASTIRISWREIGGPVYELDRTKGYGLSVIERFSSQGLKLESDISTDEKDVIWTLEGPLANIGMHSTPLRA